MARVGFDLDQTILRVVPEERWDDASSVLQCEPLPALQRLLQHIQDGDSVVIVTARSRSVPGMAENSREAIRRLGVPDHVELVLQDAWAGYEVAYKWKAEMLRIRGVEVFYGDHALDKLAAELAGARFELAAERLSGLHHLPQAGRNGKDNASAGAYVA